MLRRALEYSGSDLGRSFARALGLITFKCKKVRRAEYAAVLPVGTDAIKNTSHVFPFFCTRTAVQ